jgi:hypothetical protein
MAVPVISPRRGIVRPGYRALAVTAMLAMTTARAGWDGPTGLGTPNGTGAF